jgi:hypothetical protein
VTPRVQPSAIVKEFVGRGEAQVVALVIDSDGGLPLAEQIGKGEEIELVARQVSLDKHRPRILAPVKSGGAGAHVAAMAQAAGPPAGLIDVSLPWCCWPARSSALTPRNSPQW